MFNLGTDRLLGSLNPNVNKNEAVDLEGVITPKPLAVGRGCPDIVTLSDPAHFSRDIAEGQEVAPGDNAGVR